MSQHLQPPRGTHDQLPEQAARFRYLEETALKVFKKYGFGEVRTPIFEFTDVFARHVGDSTDIVTKEMYTFEDRGGESLTLRPEGTAPVVRAYYSNGLKQNLPLRLCYVGAPTFRYERPQKGRMRQHHQIGAEIFGIASPMADVELLAMAADFLQTIGIENLYVELNSLGSLEDRQAYRSALVAYFEPHLDKLSADSKVRLHKNPLRILDSKAPEDKALLKDAPKMQEYLSEESKAHFQAVKDGLDKLGIKWQMNDNLVRGLDYYSHTVFEIHSPDLGAQSQVLSGGRYNGLIAQMGGDDVPAVGFGSGIERLEALLPPLQDNLRPVGIVAMGDDAQLAGLKLAQDLRAAGHTVVLDFDKKSFKAQMKFADKQQASHVVIIGDDELQAGEFSLKDMDKGEQLTLAPADIPSHISRKDI